MYRSEDMTYVRLVMPDDVAHDTMRELGAFGKLHIVDVGPRLNLPVLSVACAAERLGGGPVGKFCALQKTRGCLRGMGAATTRLRFSDERTQRAKSR